MQAAHIYRAYLRYETMRVVAPYFVIAGNKTLVHSVQSRVWTAHATSAKGEYMALFNVSDSPIDMECTWQASGLAARKHPARSLAPQEIGTLSGLRMTLRPHASVIYRIE